MKKIFSFIFFILMSIGGAFGATSTLTFTSACGGSGTADDGVSWVVTSDGSESNFDNTKGIHYGTNSAQVKYITLTTSDISGTITKVVVNASTASSVSATVDVSIGGSAFGGSPQALTTSASNYTFNGSSSGEIIVTITKPSKATKAIYCKSITVTYSGSSPTTYTVTYNANGGTGTTTDNTSYSSGATVTVLNNGFTAPSGKEFDKWNTNLNGTGTNYNPGETFTISSNTTLFAIWKNLPVDCDGHFYDFSEISFTGWSNSYAAHTVVYTNDSVIFNGASKQTTTITDIPVNKNADIIVKARNGEKIISCNLTCRKWSDKSQTISLFYSTNGGSSYTSTGVSSTNFTISYDDFPANVNVIKFSFSPNNQIGIESLCLEHGEIEVINVTGVSITDTIRMFEGNNETLSMTITPSNATNKNVTWGSLNTDVVTVSNGAVTAIAEGTTKVWVKTEDGNLTDTCVVIVSPAPPAPIIDIAHWDTNAVYINIDNFEGARIVLENQDTQTEVEQNFADSVFFSKYFEAASNVKLVGIYNGTNHDIDIADYKFAKSTNAGAFSSTLFSDFVRYDGETFNTVIASNTELILIAYHDDDKSDSVIIKCAKDNVNSGYENYVRISSPVIDFNGDDAIALVNPDGNFIDLIGAGTKSSGGVKGTDFRSCNKSGAQGGDCDGFMDSPGGWFSEDGINLHTNDSNYALATNRCLLVRKKSVKSGLNAVARNTTTFATLGGVYGEWRGVQMPGGSPNTADGVGTQNSCGGFDDVGKFDYNDYYVDYDTIFSETTLPSTEVDGTYMITIDSLQYMSCTNLKVIVKDENDIEITEIFKIPIMVSRDTLSNSVLFTKEKEDCATCDVVVLKDATLTVNNNLQNRDVKLYEGARLKVDVDKTYHVNTLSLRRTNNQTPSLSLNGNITIDVDSGLYFDLYTDGVDWRWLALPESFDIQNIRLSNGTKPVYNTDFYIRYYDGAYRAEHLSGGWKAAPENKIFGAGEGFIFGSDTENGIKKEYRFKFSNDALTREKSSKTIDNLYPYGDGTGVRPNHVGWNLIGNLFMDNIETEVYNPIRIGHLIKDMSSGSWNGQWLLSDETDSKLRYRITYTPGTAGEDGNGYSSQLLDGIELEPFSCFFIQVGGDISGKQTITIAPEKKRSIVSRKTYDTDDEEIFLRIFVGDKKTGFFISNKFKEDYEPGDDLESRQTIYQSINGYKLLYSAIPDSTLENGVLTHSNGGNVTLDEKVIKEKFSEIWINANNVWFDLLHDSDIQVDKGDFRLFAKLKRNVEENVPTGIENLSGNEKMAIYDVFGRYLGITTNPLSLDLPKGIYILKNNDHVIKVEL